MKREKNQIPEKSIQELEISFQELEEEYLKPFFTDPPVDDDNTSLSPSKNKDVTTVCVADERKLISQFLSKPCPCGENCQKLFSLCEVMESRENFRLMTWREQHSFIVGKLQTFMRISEHSVSARTNRLRARQKFDYFINADRPVCRAMFLFYHGESIDRLKRRQKYLTETGTLPPNHGNNGRMPQHACKPKDKKNVRIFIENFGSSQKSVKSQRTLNFHFR